MEYNLVSFIHHSSLSRFVDALSLISLSMVNKTLHQQICLDLVFDDKIWQRLARRLKPPLLIKYQPLSSWRVECVHRFKVYRMSSLLSLPIFSLLFYFSKGKFQLQIQNLEANCKKETTPKSEERPATRPALSLTNFGNHSNDFPKVFWETHK